MLSAILSVPRGDVSQSCGQEIPCLFMEPKDTLPPSQHPPLALSDGHSTNFPELVI